MDKKWRTSQMTQEKWQKWTVNGQKVVDNAKVEKKWKKWSVQTCGEDQQKFEVDKKWRELGGYTGEKVEMESKWT